MVKEGRMTRGLPKWRQRALLLASPVFTRVSNHRWPPQEGFLLSYARQFKARLGIPVISVGGFLSKDAMEGAIESEQCDAVAVARAMIADPLLYKHLRNGNSGPACDFCMGCAARVGYSPVGCYNPQVGGERAVMLASEGP
jgi:2,4-dienoyl-CoA reductase (NADPH2)